MRKHRSSVRAGPGAPRGTSGNARRLGSNLRWRARRLCKPTIAPRVKVSRRAYVILRQCWPREPYRKCGLRLAATTPGQIREPISSTKGSNKSLLPRRNLTSDSPSLRRLSPLPAHTKLGLATTGAERDRRQRRTTLGLATTGAERDRRQRRTTLYVRGRGRVGEVGRGKTN